VIHRRAFARVVNRHLDDRARHASTNRAQADWRLRSREQDVNEGVVNFAWRRLGARTSIGGMESLPPTDLEYLRDSYLQEFDSVVVAVDRDKVALEATCFYVTGGGQPHDTGSLGDARVVDVTKDGAVAWHTLEGPLPLAGGTVHGVIDWTRRHALMRTHTALHILCGVIWNEYGTVVTGGNMEPLAARMDFEFDPLPEGFAATIEQRVNEEIGKDRLIEVSFLPRTEALIDEVLIRTKTNLVPEHVQDVRVVDIVGLDKQADGGTHVRSTAEVGRVRVVKTESKGKGNKRIRIVVE
jgi:misacylated tRNA(Ala) deacylase